MMRRWIRVTSFIALLLAAPWPAQAIQWGAGTGTSYPTTLDTANNRTNVGGGSCSSATTTNICKEWLNDWQGAVIAIMTELGTLPKGSYADVKARLNAGVVSGTAGLSSYVAGDLLQASNTTTLARLANVATGNVLLSGGVGVVSAWGKVGLTTHVDGILPTANGGTGIAYFTAAGPTVARVYTFPDSAGSVPLLGVANTWTAIQTFSAGIVGSPIIGGTGTTSTLVLQSTSGVGASGADIIFKVGNNGATEAFRFTNAGYLANGSTLFAYSTATINYLYTGSTSLLVKDRTEVNTLFRIENGGNVVIGGNVSSASLLDLRAGDLTQSGANGQKYVLGRKTELITVASGVLTQASTITIPANAILKAAEIRVTAQPGGTATAVVTATTSATVLQQGASMSTAAGTTDVGTRAYGTNYTGVAAQTVTFTFNGVTSDALGRIRLDLVYEVATAPTS